MEKNQINRKYQYDTLNRLVAVIDSSGGTRIYSYDPAGNRVSVTTPASSEPLAPVTGAGRPPALQPPATATPTRTEVQQLCRICNTPIHPGRKFCSGCGTPVTEAGPVPGGSHAAPQPARAVCPDCGSPVRPGIAFCGDCGRKLY
jgi:YD repeat-containing protein